MKNKYVKIAVNVPESHADALREAIGKAGAGKIGNYSFCSFSSKGTGRFKPEKGAHPRIGKIGKLKSVAEERIEVVCERKKLAHVLAAIKKAHPYEEIGWDIYPLESTY
ncbi:MAG: hypothetical protein A2946_01050 [Candidatus Liptonbacteria bacterium RIFCSPLOWO2_01_FULL_53_13]|uniref:NGG1p interacting factor NIF3 n=1 Tax=Candidatus Liptonbacteria bacterium RIFCSPLOWO2_01_FULL_53_13 TaxID=1798651 RepID=A0A1G2CLA0_9BACT|nr:MAG: hypothetical protein A2946_01050 [Candidatus Liptonbacteria bacterium RIFCSPLOWO2_01_FULL_53_13]